MSLLLKDRVKETTTTTGTGTLTLVSAPSGFRRFNSVLSDGDTTYYCIESGAQWEVGVGTYSANTLARTTVIASSNANALVNITASRSFVFITYAADKAVYKDGSGRTLIGAAGIIFSDNTVQTTAPVSVDLTPYLTSATAAATYVPYTGATGALNLGSNALTVGAITASGDINIQTSSNSSTAFRVRNAAGVAVAQVDTSNRNFIAGGDAFAVRTGTGGTYLYNSGFLAVTNSTDASSATADTFLSRASAGVWRFGTTSTGTDAGIQCGAITASGNLSLVNSTTAMQLDLYKTYTSATSFGRLTIKANSSSYQIGSAIGSAGGSNQTIEIGHYSSGGTFTSAISIATNAETTFSKSLSVIGTTTHAASGIIGSIQGAGAIVSYYTGTNTIGFGSGVGGLSLGYSSGGATVRLASSASALCFDIYTGSAWIEAGRFSQAGLFGVGTDSPTSQLHVTQRVVTSGSPTALTLTDAAHTTMAASTEATSVNFNLSSTKQFATGAISTQRAMRIQAPTYSFVGASTITTASTLSISGAPAAGTNATITNSYALNVESGTSYFAGAVSVNNSSLAARYSLNVGTSSFAGLVDSEVVAGFYNAVFSGTNARISVIAGSGGEASLYLGDYSTIRVKLTANAAGVLEQRNSTIAQTFRVAGTWTSTTSYEVINVKGKASANFEIGPENGSAGGTLRGLTIGGYSAGSSTIAPWLTFTNTGAATFVSTATIGAYTLPATDGTASQVLQTNGSGSVTWQTVSGGGAAGSTKQLQFNNAGSFGGATGFEYQSGSSPNVLITAQNAAYVPLVIRGATSQSASHISFQTSAGSEYLAIDVTSSTPVIRGNSGFSIEAALRGYAWFLQDVGATNYAAFQTVFGSNQLSLASTTSLTWSSGTNARNAGDLSLVRDAADTLAQRRGTNAQSLGVYTTYSSTTSYERLNLKGKSAANFEIGPENGSAGGTLRGLTIGGYSAGTTTIAPWLTFTNTGAATFVSTITASDSITTNGLFSSDRYAVSANYRFRRANGTSGSPSQVTSGQAIGALSSFGYHDTGAFHTSAGALIYFIAAENYTSAAHGTNIQFWTTPTTSTTSAKRVCIEASGEVTLEAGSHLQTSGAGFKIGTATSQKVGFWNATPVIQQTTASASATVVGGGGTTVTQTDTFDGYTLAQVVKALRTIGILA